MYGFVVILVGFSVIHLNQDEPQRKRARAVMCLVRRRKRVADRKRRELEIEKNTISSDEENIPIARHHRRKNGRNDEHDLYRKRTGVICHVKVFSEENLNVPVTSLSSQFVPNGCVESYFSFSVPNPSYFTRSSTEEEKSARTTTTSSKHQTSETPSDDGNPEHENRVPVNFLKNHDVNKVKSVPNDVRTNHRRKLSLESDDFSKRIMSDCEGAARKRRSSLHLNASE